MKKYDKLLPKAKQYFKLDEKQIAKLRSLKENGIPTKDLAEMFSISITSVKRYTSDEIREKDVAYSKKYRKQNFVPGARKRTKKQKKRLSKTDKEYKKTIRGFFVSQYNAKRSNIRTKEKLKKIHEDVPIITLEDLLWLWDEHVRKYGVNCYYTGVPLTFYDPDNLRADTLCTIDRFDSERGYTIDNIVFCSWGFNARKRNITIKDCIIILKKFYERRKLREHYANQIDDMMPERRSYSIGGVVGR
tara:strand:+ start:51 stop:788 length:738 start_codon:yes stop_codon:yes gene_type:complete